MINLLHERKLVESILSAHYSSAGPFTFFAPTDEAFKTLPEGELSALMAKPQELKKTLLSHVLPATMYSRGLGSGTLGLARGGTVPVTMSKGL